MNIPSEANEHYFKPVYTRAHTGLFCVPYAAMSGKGPKGELQRTFTHMAVVNKNNCSHKWKMKKIISVSDSKDRGRIRRLNLQAEAGGSINAGFYNKAMCK